MLPSGSESRLHGCGVRAGLSFVMTWAFAKRCMRRVISHGHGRIPSPFPCRLGPSAVAATAPSPAPLFSFHNTTTTTFLPPSTTQSQPPLLLSLFLKIDSPSHPPVGSLHLASPRFASSPWVFIPLLLSSKIHISSQRRRGEFSYKPKKLQKNRGFS